MKIVNQNLSGTSAAEAGRASEPQRTGREEGTGSTGGGKSSDRVELSHALNSLSQALLSYSNNRASRVQALAAQYQSGLYQPDSMATGKAMITEALAQPSQ